MIEEIKNLQFKIIKAREKTKEHYNKCNELFIARSYLYAQEQNGETTKLLEKLKSEQIEVAEKHLAASNLVTELENELYDRIDEARSKGIQFEVVLNPGWIYVLGDEVKE